MGIVVRRLVACQLPEAQVRRMWKKMLDTFQLIPQTEVSLVVCNENLMRRCNRIFRHKKSSTDVLSFSLTPANFLKKGEKTRAIPPVLGEVIISWSHVVRQARAFAHSPSQEFLFLAAHGILHLLGCDHERSKDARRMKAFEKKFARTSRL